VSGRILALASLYDERQLQRLSTSSLASNTWKNKFFSAASKSGYDLYVVSTTDERAWPFGSAFPSLRERELPYLASGKVIATGNIPYLRWWSKSLHLLISSLKRIVSERWRPELVLTYSCQKYRFQMDHYQAAALIVSRLFGIPWVNIVADGAPPVLCKAHIMLAWATYLEVRDGLDVEYFEGGVELYREEVPHKSLRPIHKSSTILMYSGSMGVHGGVEDLIAEVETLEDRGISLWLSGPAPDLALLDRINHSPNVTYLGLLSEEELKEKASKADIFVNPRNLIFKPNEKNFPSKLLFYLGFAKPILSTRSGGIPPEYEEVLEYYSPGDGSLRQRLLDAAARSASDNEKISNRIRDFVLARSWEAGVKRVLQTFLQ